MNDTAQQTEELISNRVKFNAYVYTPLDQALSELDRRKTDARLKKYLAEHMAEDIPLVMKDAKCSVLFRQLTTPNHEVRRFLSLMDGIKDLKPVFLEYLDDKFTDNNEWKYHLGKMSFYHGKGKKGGDKIDRLNIIDFNTSRGKKISEVKTLWGQDLSEFHHEVFDRAYKEKVGDAVLFDASKWFRASGSRAQEYYKNFLSLFVMNGILFENFMLDSKELSFTRDIFLPAFIHIENETGVKPLIVALEPTEIESEIFWMCHPAESMGFVHSKLKV